MKAKANPATYRRWLATRVLIIDEISMLNADFFDLVDKVAREIRGINTPFGGIQMILCGSSC